MKTLPPEDRPRLILVDGGFAEYGRVVGQKDVWTLEIGVVPERRGRGIGRELFGRAFPELEREALTVCRAGDEASLGFAARREFTERKRDFESRLDPSRVPEATLQAWAELPPGFIIEPMAPHDSPAFRRKFHTLFETVRVDTPRLAPPVPLTFEFFDSQVLSDPALRWDGSFVAFRDGELVGFTGVYDGFEPGTLSQWLTATVRSVRGQGIAKALKARAILWARDQGVREIRTDNDTTNAPMLAINEALGFVRQAELITLARPVS